VSYRNKWNDSLATSEHMSNEEPNTSYLYVTTQNVLEIPIISN